MAEGFLRHFAGDQYEVLSAGTYPMGLNSRAVETMQDVDIDISDQRSQSIDEFDGMSFDYVVTVCDRAKESCPTTPAASTRLHWSIDDPTSFSGSSDERQAEFARVRDIISERAKQFIQENSKES
tara:strand:+ start:682 stop:1056 length:375 start_codon:yes stop_codon:yes gene_type:complete